MQNKYQKVVYKNFNSDKEEHWDIRYHKDSPCTKCESFDCPIWSPFCNKYREFLKEQLKIKNEKQEEIDRVMKNSYIYKIHQEQTAKDDKNGKSKRVNKNNKNNKSDRRK